MKRMCFVVAVALATAAPAAASKPCGIYAHVTGAEFHDQDGKVVMDAEKAERIKITGQFILIKTSARDVPVVAGYMYFKLDDKKKQLCRAEWADLKAVAGEKDEPLEGSIPDGVRGRYVAFGSIHGEPNEK